MLYFAYGSNLNWEQIRRRCPSAGFVDLALLPDHRLAFNRYCGSYRGGVADVVPESGAQVWGVIYALAAEDLLALDNYEGYRPGRKRNAYVRQEAIVWRQGDPTRPEKVFLYRAVPQQEFIAPSRRYKKIIQQGAVYWGLPRSYLDAVLEPVPCQEDLCSL